MRTPLLFCALAVVSLANGQGTRRDQTIMLNGKSFAYQSAVESTNITDDKGETTGTFVTIAYNVKSDAGNKRPITFVFNGGPGSASLWLHLGLVGPRRVELGPDGYKTAPPYRLVDNQETILPETDLVLLDPVGTGFSRPAKPEYGKMFWGVQQDINTVGEFIRTYLRAHGDMDRPVYVLGESYGGIRAPGVANWLVRNGIGVGGVVLVSPAIDFSNLDTSKPLGQALFFPTYAASAWYHKKLSKDMQAKTVGQVFDEAQKWADTEYLPALIRRESLTPAEKKHVLDQLVHFTGLNREYLENTKLGIREFSFFGQLLNKEHMSVGRYDARYVTYRTQWTGDRPEGDASDIAIQQPFVSGILNYYDKELGYETDAHYYPGGNINGEWVGEDTADSSSNLARAMHADPHMKVFVAMGYYDLACPMGTVEESLDTLNLDPRLRGNITTGHYPAGHMMYIDETSRKMLAADLKKFYSGN